MFTEQDETKGNACYDSNAHTKEHIIDCCTDNDTQERPEGYGTRRKESNESILKTAGQ